MAVLEAVSESRRQVLAQTVAEWTDDERNALASGLTRLGFDLQHLRDSQAADSQAADAPTDDRPPEYTDEGIR